MMVGDFEEGCDYMVPGTQERPHPRRCGERVAQVSAVWDSGYGKSAVYHRCVNHQAELQAEWPEETR